MSQFLFQEGQTVLFIGDSITDCGRRGDAAPYGNGYVRAAIDLITARYPERQIRYVNTGIGGNTVADLRARWQEDAIAHRPDWLSVKIGINDLHRTLECVGSECAAAPPPETPHSVPPERFEPLYREILQLAREKTSARLILIDPFYISTATDGRQGEVLQRLPAYLEIVHRLAQEFDAISVRTHEAFQEQLRYRPASQFCPEPVHPNLAGHLVIAHTLLHQLGW
jgi:lysophospholipase L1-like esterase